MKIKFQAFTILSSFFIILSNIYLTSLPGEFVGRSNSFYLKTDASKVKQDIKFYSYTVPELYNSSGYRVLDRNALSHQVKILVFQKLDTSIMPFLNIPQRKDFFFAKNSEEFSNLIVNMPFDFVVITSLSKEEEVRMYTNSYKLISRNNFLSLFAPVEVR